MAKINPLLILGVLAGSGLILYSRSKRGAVEKLQFEPVNVNLSGKFPQYKADLQLQITNPSSTTLSVNSIFADVVLGKNVIGKIVLNKSFVISPKKENLVAVPIRLKLGEAVASLITAIYKKEKIQVSIKGIINSEGVDINVDEIIPLIP